MKQLNRRESLGLILFATMMAAIYATFVLVNPLPPEVEIPLLMTPDTILAKGLASEVYLSGTVITVPFKTFQTLSDNFLEQKIIIESLTSSSGRPDTIKIHYLGKDEDGFTYHATEEHSCFSGMDNLRIEGNTLKYYRADNGLTGKIVIIFIEACVAAAILAVGFWPRLKDWRDC